ncbi:winged helix-turn-helix transcriptional regulator [Aquabacterium sp. OR-4]|uniref:winged helix-turn-helix transcriptional regulator n=1 Tax=Aquabacterium sp. OR-4 TaxID=2978127 RepID=UPI0021B1ED90|nr:helix-turn-helix domain-containing protein [Aquabacterium sp. OR-4]MDT7836982.1 helix-turn-helix domain-containing protein [Aquabacterium sp. OR-4]
MAATAPPSQPRQLAAVPAQPDLAAVQSVIGTDRPAQAHARHLHNLARLLANMACYGKRRDDPVRTVPALLGDRWSSLVMHLLSGGMLRHTELRRLIGLVSAEQDISQRVLTLKLRTLERDGLVLRQATTDVPPRMTYQLSALGEQAYAHFSALVRWAEQTSAAVRAARDDYDRRHPGAVDAAGHAAAGGSGDDAADEAADAPGH